ncbi:MAG: polysaccharide biosynthesis/export family protein [Planctomycetota bacterium]|jgi:polysaccharide export outer membrane protein
MDFFKLFRYYLILILSVVFLFGACTTTHNTAEPRIQVNEAREKGDAQQANHETVLGVGDEIKVTVWRKDDLTRTLRIGSSGIIFFPLVGEIQATGLTPEQLNTKITEGLEKYFINPQVNVNVTSFRSRRVYVLGEVRKPGMFFIEDSMKVLEAISLAGGFTLDANTKNVILVSQSQHQLELSSLDLKALLEGGEQEQNVPLQKGDIVYVTPTLIADVERFMRRFYGIIEPIVELERGIIFGDEIADIITGKDRERIVISR